MKAYKTLASLVGAIQNLRKNIHNNPNAQEWLDKHEARIENVMESFPSGGGFDNGTTFDIDASSTSKLVFHTSFHHMNDNGYYDGWTEHTIRVYPDLAMDFTITISGKNKHDIKGYIGDTFTVCLDTEIPA